MRQRTILLMVIMAVALEVTGTLACTCPTLPPPKVTLERADAVSTEEIQQVYSDVSAEEVKQPLQKAIVLDTLGPWRASGGWGSGHHPYAKNFLIDTHPKFIVEDANSLHTWIRYDLLVDFNRYPIAVMRYRARNLTDKGWYSIWMDDGTGPAGAGVVVFDLSELIDNGETHELRRDLRELKPKGPIIGMALSVYSDNVPAVFELLEFRFEEATEPSASLVTMTALGVMFEFRPPAGSSGWIDMELYEHGGEMLAAFSCPHTGEPIQIWLAEPVDQNDPAKYYLRYRIRITAAPLPKWRVIGVSRMPKTTNKTSDSDSGQAQQKLPEPKNVSTSEESPIAGLLPHGEVKDGLAAFLLCHSERFKIGQVIPLTYGIINVGSGLEWETNLQKAEEHSKLKTRIWWLGNNPELRYNYSWFEVTGPDGNNVPYRGGTGTLPNYSVAPIAVVDKCSVVLYHRQFVGYHYPDLRGPPASDPKHLRHYFDLSRPGTYKVRWGYDAMWKAAPWTGKLMSNEVQFEIVP